MTFVVINIGIDMHQILASKDLTVILSFNSRVFSPFVAFTLFKDRRGCCTLGYSACKHEGA